MKKIYIWSILTLIIATFLPGGLCAQENASTYDAGSAIAQRETGTHVTADEARAVGLRFLNANTSQTRGAGDLQMATAYRTSQGDTAFYVFNTANGFVMVAADRCATPILGYSDEGPFNVSNVPVQMQSYLHGFVEQIAYGIGHSTAVDATTAQQWQQVRSTGQLANCRANMSMGNIPANTSMANNQMTKLVMMARDSAGKMVRKEMSLNDLMNGNADNNHIAMPTLPQNNRSSRTGDNGVAPLITAMWDQGCYYNAACPADTDGICGHVPTGCVATAMGMIMHYWGYPAQGTGTHSYTPDGYPTQTVNFGATTYDWTNMPDQLTATSSQAEIDAISSLLWHCGVAVNMVYGATSSSALDGSIPQAFSSYFGYCNGAYFLSKGDNAEWLALVKASLERNRPLLYFGTDETGLGGHAFVCDGYDASDNLHFNWGWGGNGNGYFAVDALNVNEFQFNNDIHALFGIVPQSEFQLQYNIIEGGAEVTYERPDIYNYRIIPDTVIIPSNVEIDGVVYPVVAIGDSALFCSNVKHVIIPNSLTEIKEAAFAYSSLSIINLPDSIRSLGKNCFFLTQLSEITIPQSVTTIGTGLCAGAPIISVNWYADSCETNVVYEDLNFANYHRGLKNINIGANVRHIPELCFQCTGIDSVIIPNSVISIGESAFFSCLNLKYINLGNSVTNIGGNAFYGCDSVETITIPEQVLYLGAALIGGRSLTTVNYNAVNCVYGNASFVGNENLSVINIGDSVTNIPNGIFAWCHGVTSIRIPASVTRIEFGAFIGCSNLHEVNLPATPPQIYNDGYYYTVFSENADNRVFNMPCESYELYSNDEGWGYYKNCFRGSPSTDIYLAIIPEDTAKGSVNIYQFPNVCDSTAIFYANAHFGYHFNHWSNGSTNNPDTIHLICDSTVIAFFEADLFCVNGIAAKHIFNTNFENPQNDTVWTLDNEEYVNKWYIKDLDNNRRCLFVSHDNGITNSYSNFYSHSYVFAYKQLYLNAGNLTWSFDWRSGGNIRFGTVEQGYPFEQNDCLFAFLYSGLVDDIPLGGYHEAWGDSIEIHEYNPYHLLNNSISFNELYGQNDWTHKTINLSVPTDGIYTVLYYWRNGDDIDSQYDDVLFITDNVVIDPPGAIDNIMLYSLDSVLGYVTGAATVDYLDTVTLTAVPNYGYHFVFWEDGDTNITKQVVATDDLTVAALFDYNPYQVTVSAADTTMGSVSGGGTYNYLSECTITATPAEGLNFIRWSDGNKTNPRTITVTQDTSFTAIFATCTNMSTVESVSANESYTWADSLYTTSGIYEHTWTTSEGCDSTVSLWLTITKTQYDTTYVDIHDTTYIDVHDTTYVDVFVPVHDTTFVTLTDTTVLTLHDTTYINLPYPVHDTTFVTLTDTIVVTLHDTITVTEPLTWYSLQVLSEDMDKGVGAGSGQFPEGTDVEIAAIPIEGNRFLQWSDGSEANPRTITLNGDLTLTAMFTTVGVTDLELPTWYVYPEKGAFVVKGVGNHQVSVYDAVGKLLHRYSDAPEILRYSVPAAGSYYIQVDNGAAKKVTVVR